MKVLVTGAKGMIGSNLVKELLSSDIEVIGLDKTEYYSSINHYIYCKVDLADIEQLQSVINSQKPDRIIHLAALAHSVSGKKYTWDDYRQVNFECSKNIFNVAGDIPVLFISTVDVFGSVKGIVNSNSEIKPVSDYAKSKMLAENEIRKKANFDIYRLSPVYTDTEKRDIQKRYYLKYPSIAYKIGRGTEYEILNIKKAVQEMKNWCLDEPHNSVKIIKDDNRMWTPDYISSEKREGRAKIVLFIPNFLASFLYILFSSFAPKSKYTYLLHKAVYPLRTE